MSYKILLIEDEEKIAIHHRLGSTFAADDRGNCHGAGCEQRQSDSGDENSAPGDKGSFLACDFGGKSGYL